jgi:hypothetical protein
MEKLIAAIGNAAREADAALDDEAKVIFVRNALLKLEQTDGSFDDWDIVRKIRGYCNELVGPGVRIPVT